MESPMDDGNRERIEIEVDSALLQRAQKAGLDDQSVLVRSLREEVLRAENDNGRERTRIEGIREEIRTDVEWYSRYTAKHGLFADRWRRF
jgi:hypothetical protein